MSQKDGLMHSMPVTRDLESQNIINNTYSLLAPVKHLMLFPFLLKIPQQITLFKFKYNFFANTPNLCSVRSCSKGQTSKPEIKSIEKLSGIRPAQQTIYIDTRGRLPIPKCQ